MEYSAFPHQEKFRRDSNISDVDISDKEHCLLCYNNLQFFQLGKCNHKNICHTCGLRLRLIIKDLQCSICKTDLTEIVISEDQSLTFEKFENELREKLEYDREDNTIFYDGNKAK